MCLIALAHRASPQFELLVAANRDELFDRPAEPAAWWGDEPNLLAGRDLHAGGTWLGVTRDGRFGAITNYRNPADRRADAPSRGSLVTGFLRGTQTPEDYLRELRSQADRYNGFSLIVGSPGDLWFFSNRGNGITRIPPGVHGLSNHLLNEPWPKVKRATAWLARLLDQPFDAEAYFTLLADETEAADEELPRTGLPPERERRASAIRIRDSVYGTRCSTIVALQADGVVRFHERTFAPDGSVAGNVAYSFRLGPARGA